VLNQTIIDNIKKSLNPLTLEAKNIGIVNINLRQYLDFYSLPKEEKKSNKHFLGYIDIDGYRLATHVWCKTEPLGTIFIVHGYYDHSGLYGHIIKFCLELGYNVVIQDLPGHGLSSGPIASIDNFSRYIMNLNNTLEWADKQHKLVAPWILIGQSTGAAIITDFIAFNPKTIKNFNIKNIILLAPLIRPAKWSFGLCKLFIYSVFTKNIKRTPSNNSTDPNFKAFLEIDPLQAKKLPLKWVGALRNWIKRIESCYLINSTQLTIVQGTFDKTVDWEHNLTVINGLFPNTDIYLVPGARHHLVNESKDFRDQVFSVVRDACI